MNRLRLHACALALAFALFAIWGERAGAQSRPDEPVTVGTGFIAQFPEGDVYRVQVIGDAFAEGLAPALADVLQTEQRFQVNRKHRAVGSLVRPDWEDDAKAEDTNRDTSHIVVLMTGLYDKQAIRMAGAPRPLSIGSDDWKEEYARRFERLLKAVKKRNTAVYVIGQPILRNQTQSTQAEMLSDLMRQRTTANGAKFIDIHETFQDDSGGFSQFGPDFSGNRVKLREGDGILLTTLGQRKLALVVERELKRDLAQAVSDRAIPLAGDEAEQKRIAPARAAAAAVAGPRSGPARAGVQSQVPIAPRAGEGAGDQKADSGRVVVRLVNAAGREETATIDIVRPAIAADVIALLTRREAAGERAVQPGDGVVEDVGGGLTVVNSVSSLGSTGLAPAGRRGGNAQQAAYYLVLIKGERMPPKAGRSDDFTWPRTDPFVAAAPPQVIRPQPAAQPARGSQTSSPATGGGRTPPSKSGNR